jgi:glycosyltransferase involved in cell wall biosynthesis
MLSGRERLRRLTTRPQQMGPFEKCLLEVMVIPDFWDMNRVGSILNQICCAIQFVIAEAWDYGNAPKSDVADLEYWVAFVAEHHRARRQRRRARRRVAPPRISVEMPVRDGARWLGEVIISVQAQTLADFELIIVDDGSSDDSPRIVQTSARSDPRVRAIRQKRLGLVAALNRGISESRGQFIARLDADDLAQPQRLQQQSEYLNSHPEIGLLSTWAVQIDEQGSSIGLLKPPTHPEKLAPLLARANPFLHSSIKFRNTVIRKVGLYRPASEGAEDYDLWMRMSSSSVTHRSRVRALFSARLVQRAARAPLAGTRDPTSELTAAPSWREAESVKSPIYGDLARLFRLLDLADAANIAGANDDHVEISAINNCNFVLNHAERRMAQLALLNLLKRNLTLQHVNRAILLWYTIRLHPLRAAQLGFQNLQRANGTNR